MNRLLKFIVIIVGTCFSCNDMMDVHQKYLEGGEKIYAPKVDSLYFFNGKERVLMQFWLLEAPNVRSVDVLWNNYADSLIVPVTPSAGLDSMAVYIPLPKERAYTLYVRTTDIFGNHSLSEMGSATSYGAIYESALVNRRVKSAETRITDVSSLSTIKWYGIIDDYVCSEIRYTDVNNMAQTVRVSANEESTTVPDDAKDGSIYEYRTLYMPPNSIDTFHTAWEVLEFTTVESTPFNGPHILSAAAPCIIQARDFDFGGEGLAFHDDNSNSSGQNYRASNGDTKGGDNVDLEGNIGWVNAGEWQVYTVEVQDDGLYRLDVYLSVSSGGGGSFAYSIDGEKSATVTAPNNGSLNDWRWVFDRYPELASQQPAFQLSKGKHKVRFTAETGGFNVMSHRFINANTIIVTDPDGKEQGEYLVGETLQLNAAGPGSITWSSDNTGVATVDASGLVTVVGAGTATITAAAGSYNDTYVITSRLPLDLGNATGHWKFDDENSPGKATKGSDLELPENYIYVNGISASDRAVHVNSGSFKWNHNLTGDALKAYTVMVDARVPSIPDREYYSITEINGGLSLHFRYRSPEGLWVGVAYTTVTAILAQPSSHGEEPWIRTVITVKPAENSGESTVTVYADGQLKGSANKSSDNVSLIEGSPLGWLLGNTASGNSFVYSVSAVAFWDHILTDAEIAALGVAE
ncbi:MAG: Ig-like domain-containing protein [Tannerella sp.]|nr:Ig-like domain-containing protein [Tannerella sp.]